MTRILVAFVLVLALAGLATDLSLAIGSWSDDHQHVTSLGLSSLAIRHQGQIELTPNELGIARVNPDGYLIVEHRRLFTTRRLTVTGASDGTPVYELEKEDEPLSEAEAQQFLRRHMPRITSATSIGALARAHRLFDDGGSTAVLDDVGSLRSDAAREVYFDLLLERGVGSTDERDLVDAIAEEISSSSRMTRLLSRASRELGDDPSTTATLYTAAEQIPSSSGQRDTLIAVFEDRGVAGAESELARAVSRIPSSSAQLEVVVASAVATPANPTFVRTMAVAASEIPSSTHHAAALRALIDRRSLTIEEALAVLESTEQVAASSEKASLLVAMAPMLDRRDVVVDEYLEVSTTVASSTGMATAIVAAIEAGTVGKRSFPKLLETASEIPSTSDATRTLVAAAEVCPVDEVTWRAFLDAVEDVPSSAHQGAAVVALLERPDLPLEAVRAAVEMANESISSTSERERVQRVAHERLGA